MTVNVTRGSGGPQVIVQLPKHKALAAALNAASAGELAAAADPNSGASTTVTMYNLRRASYYSDLLAAAPVPDDAQTAQHFHSVRVQLARGLGLPEPASPVTPVVAALPSPQPAAVPVVPAAAPVVPVVTPGA